MRRMQHLSHPPRRSTNGISYRQLREIARVWQRWQTEVRGEGPVSGPDWSLRVCVASGKVLSSQFSHTQLYVGTDLLQAPWSAPWNFDRPLLGRGAQVCWVGVLLKSSMLFLLHTLFLESSPLLAFKVLSLFLSFKNHHLGTSS